MSKQSEANNVYEIGTEQGQTRQQMINEIVIEVGVSAAYASTLYNNARKNLNAAQAPTLPTEASKTRAISPEQARAKNKVTSFTRPVLREIREEIERALSQVSDQYGITMDVGSMSFTDNRFTTKITTTVGDGSGAAQETWNRYAPRSGLKSSDFGKTFYSNGCEFKISAYKPKGKKYNVIANRVSDGASFKFAASRVASMLAA